VSGRHDKIEGLSLDLIVGRRRNDALGYQKSPKVIECRSVLDRRSGYRSLAAAKREMLGEKTDNRCIQGFSMMERSAVRSSGAVQNRRGSNRSRMKVQWQVR
jgi:hypothetical protein